MTAIGHQIDAKVSAHSEPRMTLLDAQMLEGRHANGYNMGCDMNVADDESSEAAKPAEQAAQVGASRAERSRARESPDHF